MNCWQITWFSSPISKYAGCDVCVIENIVKEKHTTNVSLQNTLKTRKQTSSQFFSSCCCSLFVTVTVCRQPDASFSHSKSLSQIQNHHGPLYRLRLRLSFLNIIKELQFPNFQKMLQDGLLDMGVQHLEEINFLEDSYRSPTWWTIHLQPLLHATCPLSHFVGLVSKFPLLYFRRGV